MNISESAALERRAVERFGTTDIPEHIGFITPSGQCLDFCSYPHKERDRESMRLWNIGRDMDHREVWDVLEDAESGTQALILAMNLGFIRVSGGGEYIDTASAPTSAQKRRLAGLLAGLGKEIYVDFSGPSGNPDGSLSFPAGTPGGVVVREIEAHFV